MSTKSNAATISSLRGNAALANYENNYWMAMTNGTGENFMGAYNSLGVSHPSFHPSFLQHR